MTNNDIFEKAGAITGGITQGYLFSTAEIASFARWAAAQELERICNLLQQMQNETGDAHNYYAHAAVRIREGV